MKILLSLPPNLVECFHQIAKDPERKDYFCTSDPIGSRLGSGGGTTWLLEDCRRTEDDTASMSEWLQREKRILLHAGGQSRRLPGYASSGKVLTPVPVFRWARGQRLSQDLLDLQLPLYKEIMEKAPRSIHTLIASGDVYIRNSEPLQDIPEADVVCYGLWVDPSLATRHGVFVSDRTVPDELDFMLQKPPLETLGKLAQTHLFLMDIGVWLLSDRAVELLAKRSYAADGVQMKEYDLYSEFGRALGNHPAIEDSELNKLSVAVLPLPGGEFYHYGTSRELISSTLSVQNLVRDQRAIMQRKVKPHPAMFVQNAQIGYKLSAKNSEIWFENSYVPAEWTLNRKHIVTGVPENHWPLKLSESVCIDVVPIRESAFVARPYGFTDSFRGASTDSSTMWMDRPIIEWAKDRNFVLTVFDDIQNAPLFPICQTVEDLGKVLRWMVSEPDFTEGRQIYDEAEKISANHLMDIANLQRLFNQRAELQKKNWPMLASNYDKSVFYQLDLFDAANVFYKENIALPKTLSDDQSVLKRIHNHMFRAQVLHLSHDKRAEEEQSAAFGLLRESLIQTISSNKNTPHLNVYSDQIVWGRSPVRIDLAGGWTDTPPFCIYSGGNIVNVAIELNGQPPLQVYVKPTKNYQIVLRSIDLGAMEVISTWDELCDYKKVGSPFSIPKAALALAGFAPMFTTEHYVSLKEQLKAFGSGLEVTLLAAIPAGSGLGTSSVLSATVLGALSDFCGLSWDKNEIGHRTLILEQLLTTGGGWQDQYGGIFHGLKLLQTHEGFEQSPLVRWLPEYLFTESVYKPCHLLYYTGITRTAKDILAEIVRGMFLNSGSHLLLLSQMKEHAMDMYEAIMKGDFNAYGTLLSKTWEQNKALDAGTNPPAVEHLISLIKDYTLGYKLPGAGGGGYLYMVAKDPEAAVKIRKILSENSLNVNARFVEMSLSNSGLQISRS